MVDIHNQIFTRLSDKIGSLAKVSGLFVNAPKTLPFISVEEIDNYQSHLSSGAQKYATLTYEVNVFCEGKTRMSKARKLLGIIDEEMYSMNFTRISMTPVPNMENSTIYRLTARYRVETDGETLYRR